MFAVKRPQSKEEGRKEEGGEAEGREKRKDEGRSDDKHRSKWWCSSYTSLALWFLQLFPGAVAGNNTDGARVDCSDSNCLSVDVILFIMFLGAVTLGMFLSWVILWIIMRVSRKK